MRVRGTDNIVKYPDAPAGEPHRVGLGVDEEGRDDPRADNKPSRNTFANSAPSRFLIKIGTFSREDADRLSRRIAKVPELKEIAPMPCQGLREDGDRSLSFRIAIKGQTKENLFLGCFRDAAQAHEALGALKNSSLSGANGAVIFEIE